MLKNFLSIVTVAAALMIGFCGPGVASQADDGFYIYELTIASEQSETINLAEPAGGTQHETDYFVPDICLSAEGAKKVLFDDMKDSIDTIDPIPIAAT